MSPDRPVLRGTAQNPDAFFQGREACNTFYTACPQIVQDAMDQFAKVVGRAYKTVRLRRSAGRRARDRADGSGCEAAHEAVDYLVKKGRESRRAESAVVSAF